jgi:hypothetical protein
MRHDSLIRVLAAVSFFSFVAVHPASAIEASAVYPQVSALEGVRLTEASEARPAIEIAWRDESGLRISSTPPMHLSPGFTRDRPRTLELSFAAPHTVTGIGLDVEFAQRTRIGANRQGDIEYAGAGAEVRLGRNLARVARPWHQSDRGSWYIFAASDGEALTWTPSAAIPGQRGLRLQDRVTIGDTQIGITYERYGVQASLAVTQREVTYHRVKSEGYSEDESFAGILLTWRH